MSTENSRFADYIAKCCEVLDQPAPTVTGDNYMFHVGDRWIELKTNDRGDLVTFAAMVYMAPPETAMRADLVTSFNAYYLFNGGYSLFHDRETERLYMCLPRRLEALDPRDIREQLIDFADRAANVGTWYIVNSDKEAENQRSGTPSAEPSHFIDV